MMLDLLASSGKKLTELVREMWKEFGEFRFGRRDLHIPIETGLAVVEALRNSPPSNFAGRKVSGVGTLDGSKVFLENDSWILFRQSGTEPLLRVYCEAPSQAVVEEILGSGMKFVEQFGQTGVHVQ
jgi:phosphomannomutase